jgi:phage gpG-like protein
VSLNLRFGFQGGSVLSALQDARARGHDLRPALRGMAQANVSETRHRFITKRGPDGVAWRPTQKPTGSTMIASGLLLRSIHATPPTATSIELGSNLVYAAMRQLGGVIRAVRAKFLRFRVGPNGAWVAKREVTQYGRAFLGVSAEGLEEMGDIALRHVGGPLTGEAS